MTKPTPTAPKLSCQAQLVLLVINTTFIIAGLTGIIPAKLAYERWYQAPLCFDYAETKGVPDLEHLRFAGVGIASNRYPGHHCNFIDSRTETPVLVRFDDEDVPAYLDTLQVCVMIMPVIISGLVASVIWSRYYRRYVKKS